MSHKTTVNLSAWDEQALRDTLAELGREVMDTPYYRAYESRESQPVDVSIQPLAHPEYGPLGFANVGFRNQDGKLVIVVDNLDMGRPHYQEFLQQFKRVYTEKAAANLLTRYGYRVIKQSDGTFRATATTKTAGILARQKQGGKQAHQQQRVGRF